MLEKILNEIKEFKETKPKIEEAKRLEEILNKKLIHDPQMIKVLKSEEGQYLLKQDPDTFKSLKKYQDLIIESNNYLIKLEEKMLKKKKSKKDIAYV